MRNIRHIINVSLFLFAIWLLWSGHYTPLLLAFGVLSTAFVVSLMARVDLIDRETHLVLLKPALFLYTLWLAKEIIKSCLDISRRILSPGLPISPNVVRVKARQRTELGKVTYVNSITLVPGTVSMDIDGDTITVHALTRENAEELKRGEMGRRVCDVEVSF